MENYLGVMALCVISGMLAAAVHMLLTKSSKKQFQIKYLYFYAAAFYGAMSVVKIFMGEGEKTLFSSFIDIERATYLHYGIPLAVLAAALPLFMKILLKEEKRKYFMEAFLSIFSFLIGAEFLIWGVISSYNYVLVCIFSLFLSLCLVFFSKREMQFYKKGTGKDRLLFILPVILLWTVTIIIFEPNQLLLNNLEEFSIPYARFFGVMFVEGAALTVVYTLTGVFILSEKQLKAFGTIVFGISVAGYIQGNFLNGEMLLMDGSVQTWSLAQQIVNGVIWIAVIGLAVFINYNVRHKNICRKIVQGVCVYIGLMQILSLAFMIAAKEFPEEENEFVLTTNHMLELDEENNVVVFVLDWFDRQIMDDILKESPDFTKPLKDFTDYTNTTSCYAYTELSIPYLLTGVAWEYGMEADDYCEYAYENSHLLDDIQDQEYSIGVYTGALYMGNTAKCKLINYSDDITQELGYKKAFYAMNNTSKYKMMPFAVKHFYFYTTDDIAEIVVNSGEYSITNDIIFHNELAKNKLAIDKSGSYKGAFRFYHFNGAHAPFHMNDNFEEIKENGTRLSQSRGSLKIVYEYIDEMKRLGIYDNAAIIITADHGQNMDVMREAKNDEDYDMTSTPILFVKLPKEQHEKGPISNTAPVSHTDFAATVIKAVGGDSAAYGRAFDEIAEEEMRERVFTYVIAPDQKYKKCVIKGDANDAAFWTVVEEGE